MSAARRWSSAWVVAWFALAPGSARATYSILATDVDTQQVGGAGTSCVGSLDVFIIYGAEPGRGAIHAQASVNLDARDEGVALLEQGTAPADIITAITAPSFDPIAQQRQYGAVDLQGRSAGFTGTQNGEVAADRQGAIGPFTYSVQGNILTSDRVLDQAQAAFEGAGCDLADRLMLALEAGAENGEGDSRCTARGIPSDSGFIHVDRPDGTTLLHLSVVDSGSASPLIDLRADYDAWRAVSPCPTIDAGPVQPPAADADPSGGEAPSGGCGCRAASRGDLAVSAVVLLAALVLPRRARRFLRG